MSRVEPKDPPLVKKDQKAGWVIQTRKYKIITPLYGGGEETQKADSVTVVRATEVRGHLRFWWRATRGGAYNGDLDKMKKEEERIWGSPGEKGKPGPSQVMVNIMDWKQGKPLGKLEITTKRGKELVEIGEPKSPWSYVTFPLRGESGKKPAGTVLPDVYFDLEIAYPETLAKDIEAALWAWETFGGIGARTRRGFGALQLTHLDKKEALHTKSGDIEKSIRSGLNEYAHAEFIWPDGVPHLVINLRFKTTTQKNDTLAAWEQLFIAFKNFRQLRYQGTNSPFGRSQWTEPDAIRRLPGIPSASKHAKPRSTVDKFPRGKFGLPIIFKFKDDDIGDPAPTTLQGVRIDENKYIDRLASPLILRPIACSDGAVGLAAILEWEPVESEESYTPPGGLWLTSKDYGDFQVQSDLDVADARNIEPLKNINGKPQPDVLQAFLDYLK